MREGPVGKDYALAEEAEGEEQLYLELLYGMDERSLNTREQED